MLMSQTVTTKTEKKTSVTSQILPHETGYRDEFPLSCSWCTQGGCLHPTEFIEW
jgi:predicted nucleic acid binding AN1-type Zn finger protein